MDESANEGEEEEEPEHPEVGEEMEELTPQRREEIKAIRRAMDEENERIGTAHSRQSTSREEEDRPKWSRGTVCSFCVKFLRHTVPFNCCTQESTMICIFVLTW